MLITLTGASMTTPPILLPPPSKIAASETPGTLAPEAPPEVVDQLAVVFQLAVAPVPAPTQYLSAPYDIAGKNKKLNNKTAENMDSLKMLVFGNIILFSKLSLKIGFLILKILY